jgi:xanthine dehydrogenase accessory factor
LSFHTLQAEAAAWAAAGRAAVVVEVMATRGSVPRGAGTRMVVAADAVLGTIGGGHLELQAIADARALMQRGGRQFSRQVALGPSLGQCCGGAVELQHRWLADSPPAFWTPPAARFHLQLYGAGHVGRAIARLLAGVPCQVQWVDERESEFPADVLPAHIQRVCVEPVQAEVTSAPAGACFLVLTHSHALDLAITEAVLARADFAYFGLIGSQTKRARFEARLRERGFAAQTLSRMVCPIGLPGLSGKEPELIAISVVAQLLQATAGPGG